VADSPFESDTNGSNLTIIKDRKIEKRQTILLVMLAAL
jgi:hypothetical protein